MDMDWLEGLLYGLFSGLSEFLPISTGAHQKILLGIFGVERSALMDLLIHISLLISMMLGSWSMLSRLRRELRKSSPRRTKYMVTDTRNVLELRLLKTATVPLVIGMLVLYFIFPREIDLPILAICLLLNGIILYIPEHMRHGNKDSRHMSRLDSLLIGAGGALSVIPGFSRFGICASAAVARGADRQQALNWSLLLSLPGILVLIGIDVLSILTMGIGTVDILALAIYLLSAAFAFASSYLCIVLMRFLTVRTGFSGFAYYCWGAALFTFILYLI